MHLFNINWLSRNMFFNYLICEFMSMEIVGEAFNSSAKSCVFLSVLNRYLN